MVLVVIVTLFVAVAVCAAGFFAGFLFGVTTAREEKRYESNKKRKRVSEGK